MYIFLYIKLSATNINANAYVFNNGTCFKSQTLSGFDWQVKTKHGVRSGCKFQYVLRDNAIQEH